MTLPMKPNVSPDGVPGNTSAPPSSSSSPAPPAAAGAATTLPPRPADTNPSEIRVPSHGWTVHVGPTGHLYAWNHLTKRATWKLPLVRPEPPFVPFPPPVPKYHVPQPLPERVVRKFRLGTSQYYACETDAGNRFFYHKKNGTSTWRAPGDVKDEIKALDARLAEEKRRRKEEEEAKAAEAKAADAAVAKEKAVVEPEDEEVVHEQEQAQDDADLEWELMQLEAEAEALDAASEEPPAATTGNGDVLMADADGDAIQDNDDDVIHEYTFEERATLFLQHLRSEDVSPFAPWETIAEALPDLELSDREKRELFDRYCEQRAAEKRAARERLDPRVAFLSLIAENRKLFWEEFKRKYRREPRFYNFGATDRDREKLFKDGKKMKPAELTKLIRDAEAALLAGNTATAASAPSSDAAASIAKLAEDARERKRRAQEEAIKAREAQVRAELGHAQRQVDASRRHALREEASATLAALLVDYARAGDSVDAALDAVSRDPRFATAVRPHLGPRELDEAARARLDHLRDRAEAAVRDRVDLALPLAEVGRADARDVLQRGEFAADLATLTRSVGGRDALYRVVERHLDARRAHLRQLGAEALDAARVAVEAWVIDKIGSGVEPGDALDEVHEFLAADPRWAGMAGMPGEAQRMVRANVEDVMAEVLKKEAGQV
ncbi:hypothetical protein H9P43_001352 [Blastocladiella emersonii ATCC 22665]|nr:hypothetical protein H9P43_001352 [Blastocladiella emersonii ATCC 22665]